MNGYGLRISRNTDNGCDGATSFREARFSIDFTQQFAAGSGPHPPNDWYYVVGTYDGKNLRIYVNGVLEGMSGDAPGRIATTTDPLYINHHTFGGGFSSSQRMAGIIDEVRISNVGRSASDIARNYCAASPATVKSGGVYGCVLSCQFVGRSNNQPGNPACLSMS